MLRRLLPSVNPFSLAPQGRVSFLPPIPVNWNQWADNIRHSILLNMNAPVVQATDMFVPDARQVTGSWFHRRIYPIPRVPEQVYYD